MNRFLTIALLILLVAPAIGRAQETRWYKGNLHTHSLWSDGNDFPEMIADWYRSNGYHFLALSDHNVLSEGERWMPMRDIRKRAGDVGLEKYRKRFPDVIQIRNSAAGEEVRLQPLDIIRKLLEKPGEFMMIESEEISDKFGDKPIHMNATNIAQAIQPQGGESVRDVIARNFQAVEAQAKALNRPIVVHLNHPNFKWGVTASELASVMEERYFEVYNGHPLTNTLGDAERPGTEKIWDIVNTIRLAQLHAEPVYGLGTDDAHHYHTPGMNRSTPGRGWVMVRAEKLSVDSIVAALKRGDFYASSGVTLRDVRFDPKSKRIEIDIAADGDASFTTRFVGTPKNFADGGKTPLDSDKVGTVFATEDGPSPRYILRGDELYVRAVITSNKPPAVPSFEGQKAQAWTQAVRGSE